MTVIIVLYMRRVKHSHGGLAIRGLTFKNRPDIVTGVILVVMTAGIFLFLESRMKRHPITKNGFDAIRAELDNLKRVERPQIVAAIEEARGHGDLSENAEYIYAKERQGFIETRIQELETKMATADIIDVTKLPKDRVVFGTRVTLCNVDTEEELCYQIVGVDESDIKDGKISIESPIAKALIGKKLDDVVSVNTPNGLREYEILEIITD